MITKEEFNRKEDDSLRALNIIAGLPTNERYGKERLKTKTSITPKQHQEMLKLAESYEKFVNDTFSSDNPYHAYDKWLYGVIKAYYVVQ